MRTWRKRRMFVPEVRRVEALSGAEREQELSA